MAHAVRAAAALDVRYLTIHAGGGLAMMQAAQAATKGSRTEILAVTVLTSLDDGALRQIGYERDGGRAGAALCATGGAGRRAGAGLLAARDFADPRGTAGADQAGDAGRALRRPRRQQDQKRTLTRGRGVQARRELISSSGGPSRRRPIPWLRRRRSWPNVGWRENPGLHSYAAYCWAVWPARSTLPPEMKAYDFAQAYYIEDGGIVIVPYDYGFSCPHYVETPEGLRVMPGGTFSQYDPQHQVDQVFYFVRLSADGTQAYFRERVYACHAVTGLRAASLLTCATG